MQLLPKIDVEGSQRGLGSQGSCSYRLDIADIRFRFLLHTGLLRLLPRKPHDLAHSLT